MDGVNIASPGLMAEVSWQLGVVSIIDPLTAAIATGSLLLLMRFQVNTIWLIAGGALMGVLFQKY